MESRLRALSLNNFHYHDDIPIPETERRRIEKKPLEREDKDSDFYVSETDAEREKRAPEYTRGEIEMYKEECLQALNKAPGFFSVLISDASTWFINRVPKERTKWPTQHCLVFELNACLKPIMLSGLKVNLGWLQIELQKRGIFWLKLDSERYSNTAWNLIFFLDKGFYATVAMENDQGLPHIIADLLQKEIDKKVEEIKHRDDLRMPQERLKLIKQRDELQVLRGTSSHDELEEEEHREAEMSTEEAQARDLTIKLISGEGKIKEFYAFVE